MKGFTLQDRAEKLILLRFAPKNRPARLVKPVDMMKNEGFTDFYRILICVYRLFRRFVFYQYFFVFRLARAQLS